MSRFIHRHDDRQLRSFAPSFYEDGYINGTHARLLERVANIPGKLEPADQYKLYEAAYFAKGAVLEVGRLTGKSTLLLALGARDAGHPHPIFSIELGHRHIAAAEEHLRLFGLLDRVTFVQGNSSVQIPRLSSSYDVIFIDGDHSYDGVRRDVEALLGRLAEGAVVMFHDFYHPGNDDPENENYGVRQAVHDMTGAAGLSFRGRFGAIALFEHRPGSGA